MADAETLYWVSYLVAGVFIILMMAKMGMDWGSGKALQRDYLVLDTALLMDAAYAVPGELEVNYIIRSYRSDFISKRVDFFKGRTNNYNLSIKNYEVRTIPMFGSPSFAEFVRDDGLEFDNKTMEVFPDFDSAFNIKKDLLGIYINKFAEGEESRFVIPVIDTKNDLWQNNLLVFDGEQSTNGILNGIINNLGGRTNFKNIVQETASPADKAKTYNEENSKADMLVAVYYGDASKNSIVLIGNGNDESEKLAMMIASNMVIEDKDVDEDKKIFRNPKFMQYSGTLKQTLPSKDKVDIINIDNVAVFIELNIDKLDSIKASKLIKVIVKSIKDFY